MLLTGNRVKPPMLNKIKSFISHWYVEWWWAASMWNRLFLSNIIIFIVNKGRIFFIRHTFRFPICTLSYGFILLFWARFCQFHIPPSKTNQKPTLNQCFSLVTQGDSLTVLIGWRFVFSATSCCWVAALLSRGCRNFWGKRGWLSCA